MTRPRTLFLPGAGGSPQFWKPVAEALPATWAKEHLGWPGLGAQPHDPAIRSLDDLKQLVTAKMHEPVDLVAQSMGGVIAARIALEHPELVRRLVLCVTSGGVDMAGLGASEWRADYRRSFPTAAAWITDGSPTPPLPVEKITAPTLLIWGDKDPVSPVAVGRHLAERLPNARLEIVPGGDHDVASTHADLVARLIARHLS
ncbi:alpha/beta hydrolase [Reyranella sp.]|jgi:pimeloyl-ACP methyl ester carboxylesterase|uniref:alpha/beta fold hydrolase n=1 Tax=Reyranella sp. TaxID=1929291 RepID=UPI000BD3F995|nr:alpha/beta hydrolase [Reyranella sp.]OYY37602.1 MAG: 2-hydroxymuconic semialdehyde hydrolase [Rhodospirillales bacterium 35-66-84]OYZ92648.1 MAG: 2-hydroxymuconic semialdehyde hydrolase [Rhodospirillales bacterium 24-66-33]OZB24009.1 MAG: 2-hydroxymuconic semialdehyde hydrolase [Rhodospirillales bacterium 39-66-50]HQS17358.1 alpha/beta hydrolase [Reyranella sp.]HQT13915.1 alpha/beta hydrolase [Reyranella sp.]